MKKGKFLVIRGGAIGDFILTLPAMAALRERFPEAHIELLGYPHIAQLAELAGVVDRVQPIEARALANFFARHGELSEELRDYFSDFDIIISYLYDPDEIFQTNVKLCSPAQFIVGPHRPDERELVPAAKVFLRPLERLAIFDADPVPRIPISHQTSAVNQLAVHPGSGSERKNWPEAKWHELLLMLIAETPVNLVIVGGEAEGGRLARLASVLPANRREVVQNRPLREVAMRLRSCATFVGHDSGISHLASALGLRSLVLWPHTVEEIWRPPGESVKVLRSPMGLAHLSARVVADEVRALLAN